LLTEIVSTDQLRILLGHFDRYIDATRLEAEAERGTDVPGLKEYWEVRILTSGMGTLLGLSEYATHPLYSRLREEEDTVNGLIMGEISD
jgi:hypothetical protein